MPKDRGGDTGTGHRYRWRARTARSSASAAMPRTSYGHFPSSIIRMAGFFPGAAIPALAAAGVDTMEWTEWTERSGRSGQNGVDGVDGVGSISPKQRASYKLWNKALAGYTKSMTVIPMGGMHTSLLHWHVVIQRDGACLVDP